MDIVIASTPSGILTRTVDVPGRVYGSLTFAAGSRDETPRARGIMEIVALLIRARARPTAIPHETTHSVNMLRFSASGTREQVLDHFHAVVDAIKDLHQAEAEERSLAKLRLNVNQPNYLWFPEVAHITRRFGLKGVGLEGYKNPAVWGFANGLVMVAVRDWLTIDNAGISLTAPIDGHFDLRLKSGRAPHQTEAAEILSTPVITESEEETVAVSLILPREIADGVAYAVQEELTNALMAALPGADGAGLQGPSAPGAGVNVVRVTETSSLVTFDAAPREFKRQQTVGRLVSTLRLIAFEGVAPLSVERGRETARRRNSEDADNIDRLMAEANALDLRGFPTEPPEQSLARSLDLNSEDIAAAMQAALSTLVVHVPNVHAVHTVAEELGLPVAPLTFFRAITKKSWKKAAKKHPVWIARKGFRPEIGGKLILTRKRLLVSAAGWHGEATLADIVEIGTKEKKWDQNRVTLVDRFGAWTTFEPEEWKKGRLLATRILNSFPKNFARWFL